MVVGGDKEIKAGVNQPFKSLDFICWGNLGGTGLRFEERKKKKKKRNQ